jgi:hypothetical protein
MQGFKEDFESWKSSLTPEEQSLIQEQAQGEYNKAYRKTDNFAKDLPEEKAKAFGDILSKFFENENEDYKKNAPVLRPDYDGLLKKAGDKKMDFSLRNRIVEVERDADRRYMSAAMRINKAEREGAERFPQSSNQQVVMYMQNNDTDSNERMKTVLEFLKAASAEKDFPAGAKAAVDEQIAKGVPPVGEEFALLVPDVLSNQLRVLQVMLDETANEAAANGTEAELKAFSDALPEIYTPVAKELVEKFVTARDTVQKDADAMVDFYKSQAKYKDQGLTKADVLKQIWETLPDFTDEPVPPLDEEMLAELAKEPAQEDGEYMHNWGTADLLYKSEAIDAFGAKYLLGVFETKEESAAAFKEWNDKYMDARKDLASEMSQWSKSEQARLDKEAGGEGIQRIRKMLEEARSSAGTSEQENF